MLPDGLWWEPINKLVIVSSKTRKLTCQMRVSSLKGVWLVSHQKWPFDLITWMLNAMCNFLRFWPPLHPYWDWYSLISCKNWYQRANHILTWPEFGSQRPIPKTCRDVSYLVSNSTGFFGYILWILPFLYFVVGMFWIIFKKLRPALKQNG